MVSAGLKIATSENAVRTVGRTHSIIIDVAGGDIGWLEEEALVAPLREE